MGNCMDTCIHRPEVEEKQQQQERLETHGGLQKETSKGTATTRIKIVLTKAELEWLLFQLKDKDGHNIENVMAEIERGRGKAVGWKPSLESITESPEVQEMDR